MVHFPKAFVSLDMDIALVAELLKKIPGFEEYNPMLEVLAMIKSNYGLKDAPRAWRKKLHEVLTAWGTYPSLSDPQVYMSHLPARRDDGRKALRCILSTHVDDLKGASIAKLREHFFAILEGKYDKL